MLESKSTYQIKIGVTMDYMLLGLGVMVLGLILGFVISPIVSLLVVPFGVVVMLSIKGLEIDSELQLIKNYYWFFGLKYGQTTSIDRFDVLVLTNHQGETMMNSRGRSSHVQTNSYALILMNKDKAKIELKEYETYKEALKFLKEISDFLNVESVDKVEMVRTMIKNRGVRR